MAAGAGGGFGGGGGGFGGGGGGGACLLGLWAWSRRPAPCFGRPAVPRRSAAGVRLFFGRPARMCDCPGPCKSSRANERARLAKHSVAGWAASCRRVPRLPGRGSQPAVESIWSPRGTPPQCSLADLSVYRGTVLHCTAPLWEVGRSSVNAAGHQRRLRADRRARAARPAPGSRCCIIHASGCYIWRRPGIPRGRRGVGRPTHRPHTYPNARTTLHRAGWWVGVEHEHPALKWCRA